MANSIHAHYRYNLMDDHLKNHSFAYNKESNSWNLGPSYDLTYSLNSLFTFKSTSRA
jgi:serine/threonine-protein kinase HipA